MCLTWQSPELRAQAFGSNAKASASPGREPAAGLPDRSHLVKLPRPAPPTSPALDSHKGFYVGLGSGALEGLGVLHLALFESSMPTKVVAKPAPQGRLEVLEVEALDNLEAFKDET